MELQILDWIQNLRTPVGDVIFTAISRLGNGGMIWLALGGVLLLIPKKRWNGVGVMLALGLDGVITNLLLKPLVARTRPFDVQPFVQLIVSKPEDYSFPSGHTAAAFAAAAALYFVGERRLWKPAIVLAVCMAFSRMYLYVHYPTDILGGVVVGIACGYLGDRLVAKIR